MRSISLSIPIQILFTILIFLSLSDSINAINLPFFSKSTTISHSHNVQKGIKTRGYLSSSKRLNAPKRFGYFSFSRHPRSLPNWNPLEGVEGVLIHQGLNVPRSHPDTRDLSPESVSSRHTDNVHVGGWEGKGRQIIQEIHPSGEDRQEEGVEDEDEEEGLVERDGDFSLEDCEKRQDYNDPLPIAQLGSIPEKQIELAKDQTIIQSQSSNDALNVDSTSTDGTLNGENLNPMNDRLHNDKILWSGIEDLLPLEKGILKRHSDKSNHPKYGDGGEDDGGRGRTKGGKHGKHNDDDEEYQGSGGHGEHQSDLEDGHYGGGGGGGRGGRHQGGWDDDSSSNSAYGHGGKSHQGSGSKNNNDGPNWHGNRNGGHYGDGRGGGNHGKVQQDWESPSSDDGGYHHGSSYGSKSMNGGGDEGNDWHHPSNYNGGSKGNNGNGNKWDDGFDHHPWNPHSNSDSGSSPGSDSNWSNHPPSSSKQWNHPSSNWNTNDNDNSGDHPWHTQSNSQDFSSQSESNSNVTPNNHRSDCMNLSRFYKSFQQSTSDGWVNHNGWSSGDDDSDCCQWFGVTCDPISRRVTALNLRNNGLNGELDGALFGLDALMRIDLSQNTISSLPDKFDTLIKLTHLNVSSSSLPSNSKVPNSVLNSNSIINLDLSNNLMNDFIQISSSTIKSLDLSNNKLIGFSINSAKTTNLSKIILQNNGLIGNLPDLSGLRSLQSFDGSYNNTGPLFDISNLTNLTRFDVRFNQLTGDFPTLPPSIQSLYLSSNQFTGSIPSFPPPSGLTTCYVLPNSFSPCPTKEESSNPESLASKCHLRSCGSTASTSTSTSTESGSGTTIDASQITSMNPINQNQNGNQKGIPVNPLPGENLNTPSSPMAVNQNQTQNQNPGAVGSTVISGDSYPGLTNKNQNQNQHPQSQRLGSTKSVSSAPSMIGSIHSSSWVMMFGVFISSILFGFL